jgi:hypothetical protein
MNRKLRDKGTILLLVLALFFTNIVMPAPTVIATTKNNIKVFDYIKIIVQAIGLEVDTTKSSPYLNAALKSGIVKSGDFKDYKSYLTRTDAAVLLNRADEYLNNDTVDSQLLDVILKERISDINKIEKGKREAVAKVYAKGYLKGYSNGYYIKNRAIKGHEYMTISGARGLMTMLKDAKKRSQISPDGQLIRTTNLPKNAKDYPYILATYPNSFYELKFEYQRTKYYFNPEELVDYASPAKIKNMNTYSVDLDKYKDTWMERVETNLKSRLNVNYKTVGSDWINSLRSSYTQQGDASSDKKITDEIKSYVNFVKKNEVVIQSKVIDVEPSTLYYNMGYYVRVYIKFKVNYSGTKLTADELISGDMIYMPGLKKNTWYEGVYDIRLGTVNGSSDGSDYYVTNDSLLEYEN